MADDIEDAQSVGLCPDGLSEMQAPLWAVRAALLEHIRSALERRAHHLSAEQLDYCASMLPKAALFYAAAYLRSDTLDRCAVAAPDVALKCAAHLLSSARLDWCAEREPRKALQYAADLLTPERLDWCAVVAPCTALFYAAERLTPTRLSSVAAYVADAASFCKDRLNAPDRYFISRGTFAAMVQLATQLNACVIMQRSLETRGVSDAGN